jgi:hypothetical protein
MTTVGIKIGKEVAVIDNPEFGVQVDVEIAFRKSCLDSRGCGLGNRGEWVEGARSSVISLPDRDGSQDFQMGCDKGASIAECRRDGTIWKIGHNPVAGSLIV